MSTVGNNEHFAFILKSTVNNRSTFHIQQQNPNEEEVTGHEISI